MTPEQFGIRLAGRKFDSVYPRFGKTYWPRPGMWYALFERLVKLEGLR